MHGMPGISAKKQNLIGMGLTSVLDRNLCGKQIGYTRTVFKKYQNLINMNSDIILTVAF